MKPETRRYCLIFAVLLFGFSLHALLASGYDTDDAFISFRYARNLAAGNGLTFNPGERVEGYTNFLWTVLMALSFVLHVPPLLWARLAGFLAGAGLLVALYGKPPLVPARMYAGILLMLNASLVLWSVAGLETSLFTLLVFYGFMSVCTPGDSSNRLIRGWAALFLAMLTRPEGVYFFIAACMSSWFLIPKLRRRFNMTSAAAAAAGYSAYFAWRYRYYGFLLPNTFYAKTGTDPGQVRDGLRYLLAAVWWLGPVLGLFAVALVFRRANRVLTAAALTSLGYLLYVACIGGDWMPAFRFLAPVTPLLLLGAGEGLQALRERFPAAIMRQLAVPLVLVVVGIASLQPGFSFWRDSPLLDPEPAPDVLEELGKWLHENAAANEVIAVVPAGKIPFYSNLRTIDMRGLLDLHIAHQPLHPGGLAGHEKQDNDYVLGLKPDYIITTGAVVKPGQVLNLSSGNRRPMALDSYTILRLPDFTCCYKSRRIPLATGAKDLLLFERLPDRKSLPNDAAPSGKE